MRSNFKRTRIGRPAEIRAQSFGPVPINDSHTLFGNYPLTSTGIRVDNYSADCNYVFRRAVEIIAQNMAKICRYWRLIHTDAAGLKTPFSGIHQRLLTRQANNYTSAFSFWELLESWAKGWGNGYAWILRRNNLDPVWLYPLHPSRVSPRLVRGDDPENPWELIYQIDGGRATFLPYEMLHIKGNPGFDGVSGYNIVQLHENTLAISQAQGEFTGEFYKNGAVAGGLVELPAGMLPATVQKYQTDFQNKYASRGNRHMLALVDSGVKFTKTSIDPEVAQLLESRKFSIFEVCLMVGVPPTVLGDLTSGTFSNTEQQQLALAVNTLHPIAECWRQEADMKLTPVARPGEEYEWQYDTAMKKLDAADTTSKNNALHMAVGGPWMSVAETRAEDGLPKEVIGTIYPPPNMNAAPGEQGKGDGEKGGKGAENAATEGADGKPHRGDDPGGRDGAHDAEPQAAAERVPRDVRPGEEPLESRDPQFRRRPLGHARQRHPRALQRRRQDRRRTEEPYQPIREARERDPWDTDAEPPAASQVSLNPKTRAGKAIYEAAAEHGLEPEHLAEAVQYAHEMATAKHSDREAAKEHARQLTGLTAGDLARMENAGHDYTSRPEKIGGATGEKMRKFDLHAQEIASHHPGQIGNLSRGGAESSDLAAGLWQLIREGKQRAPQPHDREVMKDAVDLAHASQPYHQTAHAYAGEF